VRERTRTAVFTGLAFGCAAFGLASAMGPVVAQDGARAARVEGQEEKHWQAVAPGRVESISGEIKVGASIVAPITDALVKAGDKVLLCTDGVTNLMDAEEIAEVLAESSSSKAACDRLIELVLDYGALDNITAIVASYSAA